jgi:release factor glutamine methyltransferase
LWENFTFVVGTDINFSVLKNQTYPTQNLVCCNGADALNLEFDLIVCNLPYLATDKILDAATDGGIEGIEIPKKIFDSIQKNIKIGGKFLFVTTSLSSYQKLMDYVQKLWLEPRILAKKKLFFEELILVEAIRYK